MNSHLLVITTFLVCIIIDVVSSSSDAPLFEEEENSNNEQEKKRNIDSLGLPLCPATSYEISQYEADQELEPCILYDIDPFLSFDSDGEAIFTKVALVQVTPSICHNHRDGANTAVSFLNNENDGRGFSIGYESNTFVKFRLISIIGGNNKNIGNDAYSETHIKILDEVLDRVDEIQFILGSCSFASAADKPIALKQQKIVLSQVGPPGFYINDPPNPYIFGIHVNSDTYPIPALKALQFYHNRINVPTSSQSVRVVYRDRSEFFKSTCRSAIDTATAQGFNVTAIEFNPDGDDSTYKVNPNGDGNEAIYQLELSAGVPNSQNLMFLEGLADQLCDTNVEEGDLLDNTNVAVFACVQGGDADVILARMRSKGCRPSLAWFTTATWGWAADNPHVIPYFQGGGQWHSNFLYSDKFFESGQAVLDHGLEKFGYSGSYDHVVSYAMPMLIVELIMSFFRIADAPNATDVFENRYEELRRAFVNVQANTIFGPVSFNQHQRNQGRGAAGTQWIPKGSGSEGGKTTFELECVSPLDQAEASIVFPSLSALPCQPGSYIAVERIAMDHAILEDKCATCPTDTFTGSENTDISCSSCPEGSASEEGSHYCLAFEGNMTPIGVQVLGYIFVGVNCCMALGYMVWVWQNRRDTVVTMAQPEALWLLCIGAIVSTSAIIPLTLAEAAPGENTDRASKACRSIPFLYSLGWALMYSSLTAKSLRLLKVARNAQAARRVKVAVKEMYAVIAAVLAVDLAILLGWILIAPLEYARIDVSTTLDEATGVLTIETFGACNGSSFWRFLGPIIAIHVVLMIATNVVLFKVRNISDRYQEQKYVALASVYICELLLLGLPVLIAVQDSPNARYIVIIGVIFLTNTGVLSLIFIPKIKYAKEGLPEGMTVMDSIGLQPSRQTPNFGVRNSPATFHSRAPMSGTSQASYGVHNVHNSQTPYNSPGGSRFESINENTKSDDHIERLMEGANSSKLGDGIEEQLNGANDAAQSDDDIEHFTKDLEAIVEDFEDNDTGEKI